MRSFNNIATLVRTKRINHEKGYSQLELSALLGYKNGQFISNVERGLCSIPLDALKKVSEILDIPQEEVTSAVLKDYEETISAHFAASSESETEEEAALTVSM